MKRDIEYYITHICSYVKQKKFDRAALNIITTEPFELLSIDFLHLYRNKGGNVSKF